MSDTTDPAKDTTGTGDEQEAAKGTTGAAKDQKSLIGDDGDGEKGGAAKAEADKAATDLKLKIPDGVDAKTAEPYEALAKQHGLKGEAAQAFFDLALKAGESSRAALEEEIKSTWAKTQADWLEQAKKDSEIGGAKFKESVALADKFVLRFGGEGLMKALRESGLGKHPDVLRAFAKAGQAISEDNIAGTTGGKKGASEPTKKQRLMAEFPKSPEMWQHLPD